MKRLFTTALAVSLLAACGTGEDPVEESATASEEVTSNDEEVTTADEVVTTEGEGASANKSESRSITEGFATSMDSVNIELTGGRVYETTLDMDAHFSDAVAGDTVTMVELNYDMENTVDIARDLFLDQAEIVTNTGEQVNSELFMAGGLVPGMKGAVKSSGDVVYVLNVTAVEELEWVDVFIPYPIGEGIDIGANEPEKHRIEFE